MLVEWAVAQFVEYGTRPPAFEQAQRAQPIGDQRDQVDLHPGNAPLQTFFARRSFDGTSQLWQRDDMSADIAARDQATQKGAWIVGRHWNLLAGGGR
jgi:hypothetical protein